jgi:toxin ParE1/3/4
VTPRIIVRPLAYMELDDLAEHLAQTNEAAANRLLRAFEQTIQKLAQTPEIGSLCQFSHPRLTDMRCWPVKRFKNHLIFYRPLEGGIEVLHIIHGARDLPALFEQET